LCGKASIDAVRTLSAYTVADDPLRVDAELLATFPDRLRAGQDVFEKTGGLHAAALFDGATGEMLVLREDVGRHNAVDKVVGWALTQNMLPLRGMVLMVSGRASFELTQKASMAGIPFLGAVLACRRARNRAGDDRRRFPARTIDGGLQRRAPPRNYGRPRRTSTRAHRPKHNEPN
jgi:FdhD protein